MMNIATLQGDASLDALAQRIYGDAAKEKPQLAERLLDANPHLKNLTALPNGTPVVVPRAGDARIDDDLADDDPRRTAAIADLTETLNDLEQQQNDVLTRRRETLAESGRLAALPELRTAGGADVVSLLDAIVRDVQTQIAKVDEERAALTNEVKVARAILHPGRRRVVRK